MASEASDVLILSPIIPEHTRNAIAARFAIHGPVPRAA